nr:hypothetical protein GCM10020093_101260 [Planobispora longispora]
MATSAYSPIPYDPLVRRVRMEDFETVLPACVAMFTEEVGVSRRRATAERSTARGSPS